MMNLKIGGYDMLNKIIQNSQLSFEARGLYLYMISFKDISIFSEKELAENGNISVKKCKKFLNELLEANLIQKDIKGWKLK